MVFKKSVLTELSGPAGGGKTEIILRFLAQNPALRAAWIEENLTVYPCAFPRYRVALKQVLFVNASVQKQALWSAHQILRSQLFGMVVLAAEGISETDLRRLQLAAEKASAIVILLTKLAARSGMWPIAVQVQVSRSGYGAEPRVTVLKNKGALEWKSA